MRSLRTTDYWQKKRTKRSSIVLITPKDCKILYFPMKQTSTKCFQKLSSLSTVLSSSSMHFPAVHSAWPIGQLIRYRRLCSSRTSFVAAVSSLIQKLSDDSVEHRAIALLRRALDGRRSNTKTSRVAIAEDSPPNSRLAIPYHPAFAPLAALAQSLEVPVVFSNGATHLWRKLCAWPPRSMSTESAIWLESAFL